MRRDDLRRWMLGLVAVVALGLGGQTVTAAEIGGKDVPLNHITADQCKDCHKEIYAQWKSSMHASSSPITDPIHNAFYRGVVGDPTMEDVKQGDKYPSCIKCHAPNAAIDGKTKIDAMPAYAEGVNCTACHAISAFKGVHQPDGKLKLGVDAYARDGGLSGPSGFLSGKQAGGGIAGLDDKENPHVASVKGTFLPLEGRARLFRTADGCMGCHDQRNNGNNVPLCQTGAEVAPGQGTVICQSCHMPVNNGLADHSMGGGHNMGMLKRSMVLEVAAKANGDKVSATVLMQNLQPHVMPTGAPFRTIFLRLSALDAKGNVVWSNYQKHPAEEDGQAYLHFVLLDENDQPTTPPKAKKHGPDNRLKPFEKRELSYDIPAKGVAIVRAEMFYNLMWPNLQAQMSALPENLRTPQAFMHAETKL